jgi:glutamate racemase
MKVNNNPIGVFDSGVGGISVLKQAIKVLPHEDFIYYGDSKNAPYGTRTVEEVRKLSYEASEYLRKFNVKALVVACNTATSAAIEYLRDIYKDIPVLGIEPALKPAVERSEFGKILVMATPMTLAEHKFKELMSHYGKERDIESLPCKGLVEFVEAGELKGDRVEQYLRQKIDKYNLSEVAAIVLGCTHYPFIKDTLRKIVGDEIFIVDGSLGTSNYLKKQLEDKNILNDNNTKGIVKIYNSQDDERLIDFSYWLLNN